MDGERISLRLEPEDLSLIDDFLEDKPEYSSRSHLARVAIRSFIEGLQPAVHKKGESKKNVVTVEIPRAAFKTIESAVRAGIYNSVERAIEDCVREKFVSKEHLEDIKKRVLESTRETVEVWPESEDTEK